MIDEDILKEEGMSDFSPYAAVPGTTEFLPDFFLDAFDEFTQGRKLTEDGKITKGEGSSGNAGGGVQEVFNKLGALINDEMVGKMQAVYAFDIKGTFIQSANYQL